MRSSSRRPLPLRAVRVANPLVRAVLESSGHRLLSGQLVLLAYRGHRTRRGFRIPLRYAEAGAGSLVAIAVRPGQKLWWRSFATPAPATLTVRGKRFEALGTLVEGEARDRALAAYLARHPRSRRLAREAAIVVFTPRDG